MEFEIGKEYKSQVKVKVGPVWMKMRMDFVVDSPTTFHGRGSGAFNNYSFDNGTIEGNKLVYTTTIMGRETTSTAPLRVKPLPQATSPSSAEAAC